MSSYRSFGARLNVNCSASNKMNNVVKIFDQVLVFIFRIHVKENLENIPASQKEFWVLIDKFRQETVN